MLEEDFPHRHACRCAPRRDTSPASGGRSDLPPQTSTWPGWASASARAHRTALLASMKTPSNRPSLEVTRHRPSAGWMVRVSTAGGVEAGAAIIASACADRGSVDPLRPANAPPAARPPLGRARGGSSPHERPPPIRRPVLRPCIVEGARDRRPDLPDGPASSRRSPADGRPEQGADDGPGHLPDGRRPGGAFQRFGQQMGTAHGHLLRRAADAQTP